MQQELNDTSVINLWQIQRGRLPACLVHIYPVGQFLGKRHELTGEVLVLGRDEACQIAMPEPNVSRRHAQLTYSGAEYFLEDLGSTNGTYINDCQIHGKVPLKDGDYIRCGNVIFRFLRSGNIESVYHEEIYRLTIMDGLTQASNQRYFLEFLDRELARSFRHRRPLSLVMIDIDDFKLVNDQYGHLAGDSVLRGISERIRLSVRREDLFARYGGDEFALILVESNYSYAKDVVDRLKSRIEKKPFRFESSTFFVKISLGIASTSGDMELSPTELIAEADRKLYHTKNGRKRAVS